MNNDTLPDGQGYVEKMIGWMQRNASLLYDQPKRMQPGFADCSSFVFRAGMAAGKGDWCNEQGNAPTSSKEVYDADYRLVWPQSYGQIGKAYLKAKQIAAFRQRGALVFTNTVSTTRKNKITHVSTLLGDGTMIQTANKRRNVETVPETKYDRVCAIIVPDTAAELCLGQKGGRVKALQAWLRQQGASVAQDGIFGKKTLAAVQRFGQMGKARQMVVVAPRGLYLRADPSTNKPPLGLVRPGEAFYMQPAKDGFFVVVAGPNKGMYLSGRYLQEVK